MTNIWKVIGVFIATKKMIVEVWIYPVVMYVCESWTARKGEEENRCLCDVGDEFC